MIFLLLLAVGYLQPGNLMADEAFVQESRAMIKAYAQALRDELQAAIEEGGPIHAISVCSDKAPTIADDLSQSPQWRIGRTSHKLRNPANAPDEWEGMVWMIFSSEQRPVNLSARLRGWKSSKATVAKPIAT